MDTLSHRGIPYLVGGTYAMAHHTGIDRPTKDLDLFLRRRQILHALAALQGVGFRAELTHPHFLGKVFDGASFVDLIFSSGNGSCPVDSEWFAYGVEGRLFDLPVSYCPIEETIWSKAFVMERERFDGHDVAHLVRAAGDRLDWPRLVRRFGNHWRVLLAHLVLFGFIYPDRRDSIPESVTRELTDRLLHEEPSTDPGVCQGTLLSRSQFLTDVADQGLVDARREPRGSMTPRQIELWTEAIEK